MDVFTIDSTSLFARELELCKVVEGDYVVLLTDSRFSFPYPQTFMQASSKLGVEMVELRLPVPRNYTIGNKSLERLRGADLIIDMATVPWLYSEEHNTILASGCKVLMCKQPEDTLRRLFPNEAVVNRSVSGAKLFNAKSNIRVESSAGTNLALSKEGRGSGYQIGYTSEKGKWDHWPSGLVSCAPIEDSANGSLVLNSGDIIYAKGLSKFVETPVKLTLSDGKITKIEGSTDALLLRDWFRQWKDPDAYGTAHIGWGTDHRALWNMIGMDSESYYGGMMIAFGSNFFKGSEEGYGLGGTNRSKAHIDIILRNCDFWADEEQILNKGTINIEDLK